HSLPPYPTSPSRLSAPSSSASTGSGATLASSSEPSSPASSPTRSELEPRLPPSPPSPPEAGSGSRPLAGPTPRDRDPGGTITVELGLDLELLRREIHTTDHRRRLDRSRTAAESVVGQKRWTNIHLTVSPEEFFELVRRGP